MQRRRRVLLVMTVVIYSLTVSRLIQAAGPDNDFSHFRLVHLALVFACGIITGALITQLRMKYLSEIN